MPYTSTFIINSANSITADVIGDEKFYSYEGNYVSEVEDNQDEQVDYNSADTIKRVQEALNSKGYDCGAPDGDKGPKTTSVIQQYQTDNGFEVTGNINDELLISLGLK